MATKYYIDSNGNYMGAFDGEHGVDVSAYTEVPNAPSDAMCTWNGTTYLPPVLPLATVKTNKISAIDIRTMQLIAIGFDFAGESFSLSTNAQINWVGMKTLESLMTWPVNITTKNDGQHTLAQADLNNFIGTGKGVVQGHLDSGRALKIQVNACTTVEAVNAIVDTR